MTNYQFKSLAAYEALQHILDDWDIPFEQGVGPDGWVVSVEDAWAPKVAAYVHVWQDALQQVALEVGK